MHTDMRFTTPGISTQLHDLLRLETTIGDHIDGRNYPYCELLIYVCKHY